MSDFERKIQKSMSLGIITKDCFPRMLIKHGKGCEYPAGGDCRCVSKVMVNCKDADGRWHMMEIGKDGQLIDLGPKVVEIGKGRGE